VTLEIGTQEVVGVIGPNGAGKTTLVNMLSGFTALESGSVTLDGREIGALSPQRRAHLGLARTFQHGGLFSDLTVRENVELGAIGVGTSMRQAQRIGAELLDLFQLSHLAEVHAGDLSHGDQQHVAVMRAAAAKPRFVLLDEPAAGLSQGEIVRLSEILTQLSSSAGSSILVIDHNVEFIFSVASRVAVMDHGELIAEGSPAEIKDNVDVVAAYLGGSGGLEKRGGDML